MGAGPPAGYRDEDAEALMLTGDENIIKSQFLVQYRVKAEAREATDFLFNVGDLQKTVGAAAEAAMGEIVGQNSIDNVLTEGKGRIQEDGQRLGQESLNR